MKIGDIVTRMLMGGIPMKIKITDITDLRIICGPWEFDKITGIEIDDEIDTQVSHIILEEAPCETQ